MLIIKYIRFDFGFLLFLLGLTLPYLYLEYIQFKIPYLFLIFLVPLIFYRLIMFNQKNITKNIKKNFKELYQLSNQQQALLINKILVMKQSLLAISILTILIVHIINNS